MSKQEKQQVLEEFIRELGLNEDEIAYWDSYKIGGLGPFYQEFGEASS